MKTIFRKELADIFSSTRFLILIILALLICAATLYTDYRGIRGATDTEFVFLRLYTTVTGDIPTLFGFLNFMALFFIPIVGIALGFDAISSERNSGTLSRVLSQPIYRDSVINAKFLAGLTTLSVVVVTTVLLIAGFGLRLIGVPPSAEEAYRLIVYIFYSIIYGSFWMVLAILFSTLFRRTAMPLLASLSLWLFFGFFYLFLIAPGLANAFAPLTKGTAEEIISNLALTNALLRFSPNFLFLEAATALLEPPVVGSLLGVIGVIVAGQAEWMVPNPLSMGQTLLLIWPHLTSLLAVTIIGFAVSYVIFMKQEIRAN